MTFIPFDIVLVFYAGVITQALLILRARAPRDELIWFPLCVIFALVGMLPGKHEQAYDLYRHFLAVAGLFSVLFVTFYQKYILDPINRELLLVWNLIFLYAAIRTNQHPLLIGATALMGAILFVNLFARFDVGKRMQTTLYAYFLCLVCGTTLLYFSYTDLRFFFEHGEGILPSPVAVFFAGASLFYVITNLWYVVGLIPYKQTFAEIRMHAALLEEAYDESPEPLGVEFLAAVMIAILLGANIYLAFAPDALIIPLAISLSYFGKRPVRVEASE